MNSSLILKKICIAESFVDPHLLWSYVSTGTIKEVGNFLKELRNQYPGSPKVIESEIIKKFQSLLSNKRKRRYLIVLLKESFEQGFIAGSTYSELRQQLLGMDEYDENTKAILEKRWMNEFKTDPFSLLQGGENNSEPLAAAAAIK